MQLGIVGLPQSGKTTVFNALTRGEAPVAAGSGYGQDTHMAVVKVPDERLGVLTEMFEPRKTTPAEVQYTDFPGVGFGSKERSEAAWVGQLRTVDALLLVLRAFGDESVPHDGPIDPAGDAEKVQLETIVSDLGIVERRLQRLDADLKRTRTGERAPLEAEVALFQRFQSELEAGVPLRDVELTEEQDRAVRGFQFLSAKPLLLVLNLGEDQLGEAPRLEAELKAAFPAPRDGGGVSGGQDRDGAGPARAGRRHRLYGRPGDRGAGRGADHPRLVRPHRSDLLPHHGRGRGAGLAHPAGDEGPAGRGGDPHGSGEGVYPGRGGGLRRTWWPAGAWSRRASGGSCARRGGGTWCRTGTC